MPGRAALGHRVAMAAGCARPRRSLGGRAAAPVSGRARPCPGAGVGAALSRRARRPPSLGLAEVAGRRARGLPAGRARLGPSLEQGGSIRPDRRARDHPRRVRGIARHAGSLSRRRAGLARLARPLPGHARSGRSLAGGALPRAALRPALGQAALSRPRPLGAHPGRAPAHPPPRRARSPLLSSASSAPGGPLGTGRDLKWLDRLRRSGRLSRLDRAKQEGA